MTSKGEKLAWELLKVLTKFKPAEIEEAISLLSKSELFEKPVELIGIVSKRRYKKTVPKSNREVAPSIDDHLKMGETSPSLQLKDEPTSISDKTGARGASEPLESGTAHNSTDRTNAARDNFNKLSEAEKNTIRRLAEGISNGAYLGTSSLLREYASRLNVELPKKLPSRTVLTLRIVEELLILREDQQKEFIDAAKSMTSDVSSLERWSNLIVRRD